MKIMQVGLVVLNR